MGDAGGGGRRREEEATKEIEALIHQGDAAGSAAPVQPLKRRLGDCHPGSLIAICRRGSVLQRQPPRRQRVCPAAVLGRPSARNRLSDRAVVLWSGP